ncbi:recombination factor protein RarA [Chlamydia abortus]|uniref:AAA family ATPase n=1 Tax=Paenibacillus residui TaxID=629724 RepID=A0ABW3D7G3_9BACL|nr:recombination factor protein RarA [Chlamydia abortus]
MDFEQIRTLADRIRHNVHQVIVGKDEVVDLLLVALVSSGHVLLEDVPGTGKTLLAKAMAKSLGCTFRRIQFTPDLLPSDLSGINYYNQKTGDFEFREGPIFSQIVLADEINRATPRTQSSLLECMEERQITVDGETRRLDRPFLVIATQNPVENQGTFPLPEAQLDRFLIKVKMGYPTSEEAVDILKRFKEENPLDRIEAVASARDIVAAQDRYSQIKVSEDILRYMIAIVEKTRAHSEVAMGVSPRGSQALLKAVQVYAILQGRDYVTPDDVKAMAKPVLAHRILLRNAMRYKDRMDEQVIDKILGETETPSEESLLKR